MHVSGCRKRSLVKLRSKDRDRRWWSYVRTGAANSSISFTFNCCCSGSGIALLWDMASPSRSACKYPLLVGSQHQENRNGTRPTSHCADPKVKHLERTLCINHVMRLGDRPRLYSSVNAGEQVVSIIHAFHSDLASLISIA